MGWSVNPKSVSVRDSARLLQHIGVAAHLSWSHSVRAGRAPAEDVSPAEGISLIAYLLMELGERAQIDSIDARELISKHGKSNADELRRSVESFMALADGLVPGYSGESREDK